MSSSSQTLTGSSATARHSLPRRSATSPELQETGGSSSSDSESSDSEAEKLAEFEKRRKALLQKKQELEDSKAEAARQESARQESARQESARQEAARQEAARQAAEGAALLAKKEKAEKKAREKAARRAHRDREAQRRADELAQLKREVELNSSVKLGSVNSSVTIDSDLSTPMLTTIDLVTGTNINLSQTLAPRCPLRKLPFARARIGNRNPGATMTSLHQS